MKLIVKALVAAILLLSLSVGYELNSISQVRESGRAATCDGFASLDNLLIKQIRQGEILAAGLAYYRQHQGELQSVINNDEQLIEGLKPPSYCQVRLKK